MSKIGKINISIPEKVKVRLAGNILNIEGPLGKKSIGIDLEIFNLDIKASIKNLFTMYNYFFDLILEKYSGNSFIRPSLYSFFIDKSSIIPAILSIFCLLDSSLLS